MSGEPWNWRLMPLIFIEIIDLLPWSLIGPHRVAGLEC